MNKIQFKDNDDIIAFIKEFDIDNNLKIIETATGYVSVVDAKGEHDGYYQTKLMLKLYGSNTTVWFGIETSLPYSSEGLHPPSLIIALKKQ